MRSSDKLKPNFFDLIPVFAVLAFAVFCGLFFWGGLQQTENAVVCVSLDGETVQEISLTDAQANESLTFSHNGVTLTVTLNPGGKAGVQVSASDCPGGDCVRTGTITRSGESIVCLPGHMVISLQGGTGNGVDAVIG